MSNPFEYGSPVSGDSFTGRREEIKHLSQMIRDHLNVALIAPRRVGKTSLLQVVTRRLREARIANVVTVNAMLTPDLGSFASQLLSGVYAVSGPWTKTKDSLTTFLGSLRGIRPALRLNDKGQPELSLEAVEVERAPGEVIGLAYDLLSQAKNPALVIDEFQELDKLPGDLPRLFKGLTDKHANVSLVIAGSQQHMMETLAVAPDGPLYRAVQPIYLAPIPAEEMGDFVQRRFNTVGKPIDRDLADRIVELAGPIPNDIQQLAHDTFEKAELRKGQQVSEAHIAQGLALATSHEATRYADTFAELQSGQRRVLIALANSPEGDPTGEAFVSRSGYANHSGVRRALASLQGRGLITRQDGQWCVLNPFFRHWLTSRGEVVP